MDAFELQTWFWDHVPTINRWLVRYDRYKFDRDPRYPANIFWSPNAAVTAHLVKAGADANYRGLGGVTPYMWHAPSNKPRYFWTLART